MATGKLNIIIKVVLMFKGKEVVDRFFIDEFGRLWKGVLIDEERLSTFWIYSGTDSMGFPIWDLQNKSGSEVLKNYEHEEITVDQVQRVFEMYQTQ